MSQSHLAGLFIPNNYLPVLGRSPFWISVFLSIAIRGNIFCFGTALLIAQSWCIRIYLYCMRSCSLAGWLQPLAPLITVNVTNVLDSSCRSSYQHLFACRWRESLLNFSPILDLNNSHMKVVAICVLHFLLLYSSVSVSKDWSARCITPNHHIGHEEASTCTVYHALLHTKNLDVNLALFT
jgi:hypothetical protein